MSEIETDCGYTIRHAGEIDIPGMRAMQERSMRILGGGFYTSTEIANFLAAFGTIDDTIVLEGHFFVAMSYRGEILGSGGWSRSTPRYAAKVGADKAATDAPVIRSVFVDPAAARRGIGSAIMRRAEQDAKRHGVTLLRLTATLSGVPLYKQLGYQLEEVTKITFPDQTCFGCVKMNKPLADLSNRTDVPIQPPDG